MAITDPDVIKATGKIMVEAKAAGINLIKIKSLVRVLGIPGIGKTTLLEKFPEHYRKVREPADGEDRPPFQAKAYDGSDRWQLAMEVHMLTKHYMLMSSIIKQTMGQHPIVSDYGEPRVFSQLSFNLGTFDKDEFIEFLRLATIVDQFLPGMVIYLKGAKTAYDRCKARGREPDKAVTLEWCQQCEALYMERVEYYRQMGVPVFIIDWAEARMDQVNMALGALDFPIIQEN